MNGLPQIDSDPFSYIKIIFMSRSKAPPIPERKEAQYVYPDSY